MKRILLALTFVVALGAAGLGVASNAAAGHGCYEDYGWHSYRTYYPAYYGGWGHPRFSYYSDYGFPHRYHRYHGHRGHHGHRHHGHGGIHFSIGF